jgi:geranylgeranyl diphosphate synthase, type II
MNIKQYFREEKKEIDGALGIYLPKGNDALSKAMRYGVFSGGKRFRPILLVASSRMLGGNKKDAILLGCAIEFIHNFTLIHDDLPCMDNDDFRRLKPTLHKVYGEAIALLAGDALLNLAFSVLAKQGAGINPAVRIKLIEELSNALGLYGLVGGQAKEISLRGNKLGLSDVEDIYMKKTASLISAAIRMGAIIGKANKRELSLLTNYGKHIGIAFQVMDDILEFMNGEAKSKKDEPNYVLFTDLEKAKEVAVKNIELAKASLRCFGRKGEILLGIADYIISRDH